MHETVAAAAKNCHHWRRTRCCRANPLELSPLLQVSAGGDVPGKDLDGDDPVKSGVVGLVDLTQAAGAEQGCDCVGAQPRASGQCDFGL